MESRRASMPLNVNLSVDRLGKSQTDSGTQTLLQSVDIQPSSLCNKLGKRKRQCESSSHSCAAISLLKNYDNFMRSGLVSRLLYHQDGEWIDFPENVTAFVRKKFEMKYAVVEVDICDSRFVLDIMRMMKFDINSGIQTAIAWIDDAGTCFFPYDETHGMCRCDSCENHNARDIQLHLQIEFDGANPDLMNKDTVDPRVFKKIRGGDRDKIEKGNNGLGVGFDTRTLPVSNLDSYCPNVFRSSSMDFHYRGNDIDIGKVHDMFRAGMGHFSCPSVIEIKGCYGKLMENRLQLFNALAKYIAKTRGNSNVQYAWLSCAQKDVSSILSYGLGVGVLLCNSAYGYGVHLSSKNHAYRSVKICDDDENRLGHMVLCRVVLGNVEPVHLGSDQSCPSSDLFDTGVDNILDPRVHIVWEMNALTHIYPEYVVSFKLTSRHKGDFVGQTGSSEVSKVSTPLVDTHLLGSSNAYDMKFNPGKFESRECTTVLGPISHNIPKSPWMPFPVLFDAISKKVPHETMQLVYQHYYMFKCKKTVSRSDFVRRMRMIVGDKLLKSTLTSLRSELRPPVSLRSADDLKEPKPDPEA